MDDESELPDVRIEHIETLERLGRLVVLMSRRPVRVCFIRLHAYLTHARQATLVATDEHLDYMEAA